MRVPSFIIALLLAGGVTASALAADLTKIDRTIAKEPAYKSQPRYCLLIFGPEAKFRVWLVLDGDVLYVDKNGNNDLTEKGEKVALSMADVEIIEPGRRPKHTALRVMPQNDGGIVVSMMTEGKHKQRSGRVTFATRSREAPILHFNGPVSVQFISPVVAPEPDIAGSSEAGVGPKVPLKLGKDILLPGKRRPNKAIYLNAAMGTPGLGEGTFVTYKARDILGQPNERIVVEAAFPHRDANAKSIRQQGFLQPDG